MIEFLNVSKTYHKRNGSKDAAILRNLSLSIGQGEFVCVLGPSGCGKTTLLNLIAGFALPTRGEVLFNGDRVRKPGPERAVVFQEPTLFPWLTVLQNVMFGLRLKQLPEKTCRKTSRHYLDMTGILDAADDYPFALSGGMRQRVSLARVLALDPEVLLMDEPFSALDANTRERLQDELLNLWKSHPRTVVYITHSVDEAVYLGDRIIVLSDSGAIGLDRRIDLERPRNRSHIEFSDEKAVFRQHLASLPCCVGRIGQTTKR